MAYKLAIFDLGGVVVEAEADQLVQRAAQALGRSFDDVQQVVYDPKLLLPFELGQITPTQYYAGLQRALALSWPFEQFADCWNSIFTEKQDVVRILQGLAKRHTLLALTNTNALHLGFIKQAFSSLAVFHHWVPSCEVGLRKPDRAIYELALQRAGVSAHEAVYVDDRPELVEAGRAVGLTAIRFEGAETLAQQLSAAGIDL